MSFKTVNIKDKQAILNDPSKAKWEKDLVYGMLINVENPGSNIFVSLNGKTYLFYDGQEGYIPKGVAEILANAKREVLVKSNPADLDKGERIKKVMRAKYNFVEKAEPKVKEEKVEDPETKPKKKSKPIEVPEVIPESEDIENEDEDEDI